MNAVFGTSNPGWQTFYMSGGVGPFASDSGYSFVFLEGSHLGGTEITNYLSNYRTELESFVNKGGVLFINDAPNDITSLNIGFQDINLAVKYYSTAIASNPIHPIINGAMGPTGTSWSGNYFAHANLTGTGLSPIIYGQGTTEIILGEKKWGEGLLLLGGMTTTGWHSPQPQATNLRANIIKYGIDRRRVNGSCGASNGGVFPTPPISNLCSEGTPSLVTGSEAWTWTCQGANGGPTVTCSAQMPVLSVHVIGIGDIHSSPSPDINCSNDCTHAYDTGGTVTLTAVPRMGSYFADWIGCDSISGTSCLVTVNRLRYVTGVFSTFTPTPMGSTNYDQLGWFGSTGTIPLSSTGYDIVVGDFGSFGSAVSTLVMYDIFTSISGNGTLMCQTPIEHGFTSQCTVMPNSFQQIASISGCGGSLTGDTYTTAEVTASCAVDVIFAPVEATPPSTTASPPGGTYSSSQSVTLTCNDSGSGCAATYYCLGSSCTPSIPYTGTALSITASQIIRFLSVDNAGNSESIQQASYSINSGSGGNVTDPQGDNAPSGSRTVDATGLAAWLQNGMLNVKLSFSPNTDFDNTAVGFVYLDSDQNLNTGTTSNYLNYNLNGIDFEADLFYIWSNEVLLRDSNHTMLASYPVTIDSVQKTISFSIPLSAIGNPAGPVNVAAILGTANDPTDWVPNLGYLSTSFAPGTTPSLRWNTAITPEGQSGNSISFSNTTRKLAVAPDGSIFAVYHGVNGVNVVKSTDNGATFSLPTRISFDDVEAEIAVSSTGVVYVAWGNGTAMMITRSTNGGNTFSAPASAGPADRTVHMATDGNFVYLVDVSGSNFAISSDNGQTFATTQTGFGMVYSDIMVDPSNHKLLIQSDNPIVRYWVSNDHGASFTSAQFPNPGGNVYYSTSALSSGINGTYIFVAGEAEANTADAVKLRINVADNTSTTLGDMPSCYAATYGRSLAADSYGNVVTAFFDGNRVAFAASNTLGTSFNAPVDVAGGTVRSSVSINPTNGDILFLYELNGQVRLAVYNNALIGYAGKTAPGAPTGVAATAGNGQATVSFTPPASNGGSAITLYTVTSSPGNITATGTGNNITVTGLNSCTAYTFTVTATNAVGTGSASTASNSVTPYTLPGAPTDVTATGGVGQATISFTPPASNGCSIITSYTVTSNPGNYTFTTLGSPFTFAGLAGGTNYTFTVSAHNAAGAGPASNSSNTAGVTGTSLLSVTVAGSGTVSSTLTPVINCSGVCSQQVNINSTITLTATPASGYFFTGWSGDCTGNGSCQVSTDVARGVTARFSVCAVRMNSICYTSLASALAEVQIGSNPTLQAQTVTLAENANLNISGASVTFLGGYDGTFVNRSGSTTINGSLTVTKGVFIADKVVISTSAPIFNGTLVASVIDALTSTPLSGVGVSVYFQGNLQSSGITDSSGTCTLTVPAGSGYSVVFSRTGYLQVTYTGISVTASTNNYLQMVMQVDAAHAGTGKAGGTVTNAFTTSAVSGATVNIRTGMNAQTGAIVGTVTTGSSGTYTSPDLNAGNYTLEILASGYTTAFKNVVVVGGQTTLNQNASLTPVIPAGQTRVILEWGVSPTDLDSHLTGPSTTGGRFHTYYMDKTFLVGGVKQAELDVDDTSSYGPETTTIYVQSSGVYRFLVHDFTNRLSNSSTALANSSAKVTVIQGSTTKAVFHVPTNQGGTLWTVFELNGTTITPINTMSYFTDPQLIL